MGSRDMLLFGASDTEHCEELRQWKYDTQELHNFVPDYHRLQIEHWIWRNRHKLEGRVLDVGVENPRSWIGDGYQTFGESSDCDIYGDITESIGADNVDVIIVTEVLEHCTDPITACKNIYRALKPGGLLFATSPFLWPWHGTTEYKDYWRFTDDGWRLLLREFKDVKITPIEMTIEGHAAYDLMRRFECMGMRALTKYTTGYMCEATKGDS